MSDFRLTPTDRAGVSKFGARWRALEYSWWSDNSHWVAGWLDRFADKADPAWPISEIGNIRVVPASDRQAARWHLARLIEDQCRVLAQRNGLWTDIIVTEADQLRIEGRVRSQVPRSARSATRDPITPHYVRTNFRDPAIAEDERQPEEGRHESQ